MVRRIFAGLGIGALGVALGSLIACGGGGNALATVVGRVLNVETGGPPNPQASVQAGAGSALTSASDGSFQVEAPLGATQLTVDSRTQAIGVWVFAIPAASGVTDAGDLWIGAESVTVRGTVRDSTTNDPVPGAEVTFAGRRALTDANGVFNLLQVAYSSNTQTAFWGIVGSVRATGYFKTDWSTQPNVASGGVVDVGDIIVAPLSDPNPPGPPFNIWGTVTATGGPQGAVVRLKQGGNDVRVFNVGPDGRYIFFVVPGTYVITASKGAQTAPDQQVTLTAPNEVIRRDFNLQ
jgi:hypothetical protein